MVKTRPIITVPANYVPLSEYNLPKLKLTPKEKKEVDALNAKIADAHERRSIYADCKRNAKTESWSHYYNGKLISVDVELEKLSKRIKEIKINRHNIQLSKLKNKF